MWAAVRELTCRKQEIVSVGVDATALNNNYACISADNTYSTPLLKQSVTPIFSPSISEERMFKILDKLNPTSTGMDQLPAWFLRLGAPIFCKPLANLISLLFNTPMVPLQLKQARICHVPKFSNPMQLSDFRPISVTAVLSRVT